MDPAVNLVIQKLTKECDSLKKQVRLHFDFHDLPFGFVCIRVKYLLQAEEAQNELAAWKFTPDSATGKRLMAKCRQLYQENEDLGEWP